MAITRVGTPATSLGISGLTQTGTYSPAPTNGNALVCAVLWFDTTGVETVTWTDNASGGSNTYTLLDLKYGTSGNTNALATFEVLNLQGSPTTFTVTITTNGGSTPVGGQAHAIEYAGAGSLDGHAMQAQASPGTGTDAITSGTSVGHAGDVSVGFSSPNNVANYVAGTGYSLQGHENQGLLMNEDNLPTGGAGAGSFTDATNGGTFLYITAVVALAPASAGTTTYHWNLSVNI